MKAADAAPGGVWAVYDLTVRRSEQVGPNYFLGSEADYRDPRNLGIRLTRSAQASLRKSLGGDLGAALEGKRLLVLGSAKRVRVDFVDGRGRPSGKYYYQTQVAVMDARQVQIVPGT